MEEMPKLPLVDNTVYTEFDFYDGMKSTIFIKRIEKILSGAA